MAYQLAYVSSAVGGVHQADLRNILTVARTRNAAHGISGLLLYRDGRFLQLLEGSAPAVGTVFRSITADPRHSGVRCLWTAHSSERWFSAWSMGFRDLTDNPISHPAYLNLLHDVDPTGLEPSTMYELWSLLRPPSTPDEPGSGSGSGSGSGTVSETNLGGRAKYILRALGAAGNIASSRSHPAN